MRGMGRGGAHTPAVGPLDGPGGRGEVEDIAVENDKKPFGYRIKLSSQRNDLILMISSNR